MTLMKDFLITLYNWTFTGEMKEGNDSKEETSIVMRIENEKRVSEETEGKIDEHIEIGEGLMNIESHIVV